MWILWLVIIGLIVYFIGQGGFKSYKSKEKETSLEILKKRYARGEISKTEFDKMKKDLQ
ncbi:MAG: SHOCT domain-containing protein [Spirochaetes bacterium]|nr:SHOCT domain-containing protein [Spirochaetota bacterium]